MIQYLGEYGFKYSFVAKDIVDILRGWIVTRESNAVTDAEFNGKIQEVLKACSIALAPFEARSFISIDVDKTGVIYVSTEVNRDLYSVHFVRNYRDFQADESDYPHLDKKYLVDKVAYKRFVEEENERRKGVEQYAEYDPKAETKRKMSYQERVIELLEILCNTTFRIEDMLLERSGSNADISC